MFAAYRRFITGPTGLMTSVFVLVTGGVIGYRWYIKPMRKRSEHYQNEIYADYIFEERQKKLRENNVQQ